MKEGETSVSSINLELTIKAEQPLLAAITALAEALRQVPVGSVAEIIPPGAKREAGVNNGPENAVSDIPPWQEVPEPVNPASAQESQKEPPAAQTAQITEASFSYPDATIEMIRAKANEKIETDPANRQLVKDLLEAFGAANMSALEKSNYGAFYQVLSGI
jgi:hypothetical protein